MKYICFFLQTNDKVCNSIANSIWINRWWAICESLFLLFSINWNRILCLLLGKKDKCFWLESIPESFETSTTEPIDGSTCGKACFLNLTKISFHETYWSYSKSIIKLCFDCFISFLIFDFYIANTSTLIALYDKIKLSINPVGLLKLKIELAIPRNARYSIH